MPTLAYVVNPNEVTVIDTSTNTVVNTIPIPTTDPNDYAVLIAITPDGKFAYVTNLNGFVSVIDTCTNTVVDTIKVGFNPIGIAITPDGRYAYVANSFDNNVSVIDTSTNTVVDTIPVGREPFGVAVAPDGNFVYVAIALESRVSVIDTTSNTVVDTIPVTFFPHGIAITPDGSFAYVSNNEQPPLTTTVSVIDTSTRTMVDNIPVGFVATIIAITPDGKFAYVANAGDDNVSVIDIATNTVIDTVPVGSHDYGVAITPDGRFAYVTNAGDDNVSVIDTSTNTVVDIIPDGNTPFGIAIANIPPCPTPSNRICIETTRVFDSCMFEEERQKTFKIPNLIENQDIQCEIVETKCSILDVTKIDEQADLADVRLQIKVLVHFTSKYFNNDGFKSVICFEKNITLFVPEGAAVCCDINDSTCECIQSSNVSCDSKSFGKIYCTVKVTVVVKSKKLVQIEVPYLGNCKPRIC
ncbi:cytochrome D1 domain-containing protein [Maledivibacter halophilus]|uniref:40-residue YVTN family beta-propeller repeat-containing protein n=1 Tax=Maledivibacter halophilus TaxID=36842 RepID=A0A1T5M8P9_9FIRM|nr:cytochrome D1 domain-containing protein [Maledivibacter halophilus]SKC84620.1 40-residue YVTN family beta-propeller repeat-containing protein [Maledivibacter halophilus]